MSESYLIVGLGNPEKKYEYTRHNLGFLVVEKIAEKLNARLDVSSLTKGFTAESQVEGKEIHLLMPTTYVNKSGSAVKQFIKKKEIALIQALVVCDDLNLDFGQLRIRSKGSDGGHNGLHSIIYSLESDEFVRLRMGVGLPPKNSDVVDYVLEEFKKEERNQLPDFLDEAAECCLVWIKSGINRAMDQFNRKRENGD